MVVQYVHFAFTVGAGSFKLYGIVPSIRFCAVENILEPFYLKYGLPNEGDKTRTIYGISYNRGKDAINNDNAVWIKSVSDLDNIIPLFKNNIEHIVLPFFSHFDTLEKVANVLAEMPPNEITNFIPSGPVLFLKTAAVLRLAKYPKFEERENIYLSILKEKAKSKESYIKHLKSFEEFVYCK